PTPRHVEGLDATQAASPVASTRQSGIDARSETGAGVGLVASERLPVSSRGKWLVLGGIAVVAVGVGFAVPRMMAGPAPAGSIPPAPTPTLAPTPTPTRAPTPPLAPTPALAAATSTFPATSIPTALPMPLPPSLPTPTATHPSKARPLPSGVPAASPSASPAATVTKPPPGSDDDIK
ncbi:MAG TPA: hypothetical protein VHS09_04265, partial [Polyangiaceae bacterium]|nr:hypothetical protein [Polyangiaceae bacterium]